jgi:hypothetical protein
MKLKDIKRLTKEQEIQLSVYGKKWSEINNSTKELDKKKVEQCFKDMYKFHGLAEPKHFVYFGSPLAGAQATGNTTNILYGAQDAAWLCYHDFFREELSIKEETEASTFLIRLANLAGWCWVSDDTVVITPNPKEIHLIGPEDNKILHNTKGPAILYPDGFALYFLNNIQMTEEQVMTPAEHMTVESVMKEPNVDVRRELLRKIGLEKFVRDTKGKVLDTYMAKYNNKEIEYQLIEITLNISEDEVTTARVLKMDNPSINAQHIEGVEDTCNTVKEALAWRLGLDEYVEPVQLT